MHALTLSTVTGLGTVLKEIASNNFSSIFSLRLHPGGGNGDGDGKGKEISEYTVWVREALVFISSLASQSV